MADSNQFQGWADTEPSSPFTYDHHAKRLFITRRGGEGFCFDFGLGKKISLPTVPFFNAGKESIEMMIDSK